MKQMIKITEIRDFMTAGNAVFTLRSLVTDRALCFRVRKKSMGCYWVYAGRHGAWQYLGHWFPNNDKLYIKCTSKAIEQKAFKWFLRQTAEPGIIPDTVKFFHMGRCGACSRPLTDPISIERGLGPSCHKKRH